MVLLAEHCIQSPLQILSQHTASNSFSRTLGIFSVDVKGRPGLTLLLSAIIHSMIQQSAQSRAEKVELYVVIVFIYLLFIR